jgi:O-antigen/teichoic acid export membrane protein
MPPRSVEFESLRKALAGNLIGRLVQVISLVLSAVVLARVLGPDGLGIVAIVSAAVRMATMPAQEGAARLCEREIAGAVGKSDGAQAHAALRFNLLASLAILAAGAVAVGIFLGASVIGKQGASSAAIIAAALGVLGANVAFSAMRGVLRGVGQTSLAIFSTNATTLATPLLYLMWIWLAGPMTPVTALWLQVVAQVIFMPGAVWLAFRYWPRRLNVQRTAPMPIPRLWVMESVQFTLLGIISVALMDVGTLFLGHLGTPGEAGMFRIATRVFLTATFVTSAARQAFGPHIALNWQSGNHAVLERPSRMISALALAAALVTLIGFAIAGKWLIVVAFGPEFEGAYRPSLIMAAGAVSTSFGAVSPRLLKMTGEQRIVFWGSAAALALASVLNLMLVPDFGATGCAIALLSAITVARVIYNVGVRRHLGFTALPDRESAIAVMRKISELVRRGV